jgi:sugar/nucleoside kinase (ribokinase family)
MSSRPHVLVVGSVALDDLHLPSGHFTDVVGGAATFCAAAASLFAPVRMVGVVGEDFPERVLDRLRARGIDTSAVQRRAGKTFKWVGKYAENLASRETLDTQLNVFADFEPHLPESHRDAPFVLLGNIHPALQHNVLAQVRGARFVAADTMNLWIDVERERLLELLHKIDCLIINDEELRQLAGTHNIRAAARTVRALGPRALICKRGEYGALLFDEDGISFVPAYPLETELDPTGAGDSFAGALLGRLAAVGATDGLALRQALLHATAVASFCVEGVGMSRLEEISLTDVEDRIAAVEALSRF